MDERELLLRQLQIAERNAAAQRRAQAARPVQEYGVDESVGRSIPVLEAPTETSYSNLGVDAPGAPATQQFPNRAVRDPSGGRPLPVDPMAVWNAVLAAKDPTQGGVAGALPPVGNRSDSGIIDKTEAAMKEQLLRLSEGTAADQLRRRETIKAETPYTKYNRAEAYDTLDKSTPQPVGRSRLDVASGFLPVWDNAKNGFDFTGAMTRGQAGAQQNIENVNAAKKMRLEDMMRKIGFGSQDNTDVNLFNADANNRLARLGETQKFDSADPERQLKMISELGGARQAENQFNRNQAGIDRRHAQTRSQSEDAVTKKLREVAGAVIAGAKNPGAPGTLTTAQGQALVDNLKFGIKPREVKDATPVSVDNIKLAQDNFLAQAAQYLKGRKDANILGPQYAARLATMLQSNDPRFPVNPALATRALLEELARNHPIAK